MKDFCPKINVKEIGQCANLTEEEKHRTILERNDLKKSPNYN